MHVEVLVGIPGSGKSTHARKRVEQGYVILDLDGLIYMINSGGYDFKDELRPFYSQMLEGLADVALAKGHNVVVDIVNWSTFQRQHICDRYGKDHLLTAVYWEPNYAACLSNRLRNTRGYPPKMWKKLIREYMDMMTIPTKEEGFEYIEFKKVINASKLR